MHANQLKRWLTLSALLGAAQAQTGSPGQLPSSYPHDYPGKPSGDYSPEWQSCKPALLT